MLMSVGGLFFLDVCLCDDTSIVIYDSMGISIFLFSQWWLRWSSDLKTKLVNFSEYYTGQQTAEAIWCAESGFRITKA